MSLHTNKAIQREMAHMADGLKRALRIHSRQGAVMVAIATVEEEGVRVSTQGGASASGARMALVLQLLEYMLEDPSSPPQLADQCRAMMRLVGHTPPAAAAPPLQ